MDIAALFAGKESPHELDMTLNFKKYLADSELTPRAAGVITLVCAESLYSSKLSASATQHLQTDGSSPEEIQEAKDAASIMGFLNCFYRFRHSVDKEAYKKPAALRMNIMARPTNGKANFEM